MGPVGPYFLGNHHSYSFNREQAKRLKARMTKGFVTTPSGEHIAIFAIEGLGAPPQHNGREMNYHFTVMTRTYGSVEFVFRYDNDNRAIPYNNPMEAQDAAHAAYQEILAEWSGFRAIMEGMAAEFAAKKDG
ncbi:MAG: hypothetical protein DI585_04740 [Pseudomonas fluorescens]|nr:MAG: hypothetical protein DI585_04740 [Pseudomonas fluorescens]